MEATTLEWVAPSPPLPHVNFETLEVHREAYEYSLPGRKRDYTPQTNKKRVRIMKFLIQLMRDPIRGI